MCSAKGEGTVPWVPQGAVALGHRDQLWMPTGLSCPQEPVPAEPQETSGCGQTWMKRECVQPSCSDYRENMGTWAKEPVASQA